MSSTDNQDPRGQFIQGLRDAAAFYEAHPLVPAPADVELSAYLAAVWEVATEDRDPLIASVARAMAPCEKDYSTSLLYLRRRFGPVLVEVFIGRDSVCERKVVGTRAVEREVVDIPAVTRTETVEEEIVEWECKPLLLTDRERRDGFAGVAASKEAMRR